MQRYIFAGVVVLCSLFASSYQFTTQYGSNNYVDYQVGDAASRIVITAPHGGYKKDSLPNRRSAGCYDSTTNTCTYDMTCSPINTSKCNAVTVLADWKTHLLATELADKLEDKLGARPHVVRCLVHRSKLDCNREWHQATFGLPGVNATWYEFHQFANTASNSATAGGTREAFYIDVHGQSQPEGWHMMGFLLSKYKLDNNAVLPNSMASISSVERIHLRTGKSLEDLVRGNTSIGAFLQNAGYDSVPSPTNMSPNGVRYYQGGYNMRRYTGPDMSGIQVEAHRSVRTVGSTRRAFADKFADGIAYWMNNYVI